eukprot:gnl/Ergobibamus_cyprinoides/1378.p1 GENE.gnl/Ergobibamus_cyprinoides/1378~~gnl/Ergobibamus_cyprinoides/1378.p1  ORF type:complete len:113 (+),score=22.02 gnl/Ergobibamus_cyprinoides/1378:390-728(+)
MRDYSRQNADLKQQLAVAETAVQERTAVWEQATGGAALPGPAMDPTLMFTGSTRASTAAKPADETAVAAAREVAKRAARERQLKQIIKDQETELEVLRAELDRLRKKTFPSF